MKKLFIILFALLLLLCSCEQDEPYEALTSATVTEPVETEPINTEILSHLNEFTSVYDEVLDAEWITYGDRTSGFFARIVYYGDKDATLRLICTEADKFTHGGETYVIPDGDTAINDKTLSVLSEIADGGDCSFGGRSITEEERVALKNTILLYKASSLIRKTDRIDPMDVTTDEDGNSVFDNGEYTIKFPSSFNSSFDGEKLTIISGTRRLRAVSVVRSDKAFSSNIADKDAVIQNIGEDAELLGEIEETHVGGAEAYRYTYKKNGVYVTQYYVDGGGKTYVLTGAAFDKSDKIPANIISTFKIKGN